MSLFVSILIENSEMDKDWLRVKSGRSKGCKDCLTHRCIPSSCNCNCHK
jgi:hypothetical protein